MKNRNVLHIIISYIIIISSVACSRDHLYYETLGSSKVQINIDWSKTAFSPDSKGYDDDNQLNGVTIFVFDSVTHHLVEELPPDANWSSPVIGLPPGTYDMILINDSREELPNIRFDTELAFGGFKAYVDADTVYTDYPEYLAVSAVRNVAFLPVEKEYYYDMPDEYYRDYVAREINTVQKSVTKKVNVKVYVKGMNYCKGMQPAFITGLSKSVNLSTRKPGKETTIYAFNLINREFRNSDYTEAILTQSFYSFGFDDENLKEGTKFELTLNFVMVDNTIHTVKTDVTPQFEEWLKEHSIELDLDLDIDVAFEVELPPVSPPSSEESNQGMAPETVPWNDIIQNIVL